MCVRERERERERERTDWLHFYWKNLEAKERMEGRKGRKNIKIRRNGGRKEGWKEGEKDGRRERRMVVKGCGESVSGKE